MKSIAVVLFFGFLLSCSGSRKSGVKDEPVEEQLVVESPVMEDLIRIDVDSSLLIAPMKVGYFWVGMNLSEVKAKYEVRESEKQVEEGNIEIQYLVDNDNIAIECSYDYEEYTSEISDIYVQAGDYMTDRGIGFGASLADFVNCYPDYKLAFSYISYGFWIESGEVKSIQFFLNLNPDDFKNKDINLYGGDYIELDYKDFDPDTRIESIRVF